MPRSKRAKIVSLTKTDSKGLDGKKNLINEIQKGVESYGYIWVFSVENSRNTYLKDLRSSMKTSRFFFGKNKVMAKALGNDSETELRDNLSKISERLSGDVGLLFTNTGPKEIKSHFDGYRELDYARAGNRATFDVVVESGEVKRGPSEESFPNNMEPQLRKLGMPTSLKKGKIVLDSDYTICKQGQILTPEQAQLLKLFWVQMAEFHINLLCYWHNDEFVEVESTEKKDDAMESD
ncbi:mRNA turnover and ribosome assembly protein [Mycoemilia scoparia]|uniref:Ribosome assembly factor mrt4 n=1 Tax=Mycoemilia scoparia TaxID=417184 RepID=A0A9W8DWM9_9FUNG|nr:mRNA turnover and ribosome assembly protein [Mycoemilia scoparia]